MDTVACFIPCCSSKVASGRKVKPNFAASENELAIWRSLEKGRQTIKKLATDETCKVSFDSDSLATSALFLYTGAFYRELNLRAIVSAIQAGTLRLFILSAGYGVVDAFEPLQEYDAEMKGQVAKHWREQGLDEIISQLLLTIKPRHVFGFFAGSESWSDPGAKYRHFFIEGLNKAQESGSNVGLSGCFFRSAGRGTSAILGSMGRTFRDLVNSNFDETFVSKIGVTSMHDRTTVISFKQL